MNGRSITNLAQFMRCTKLLQIPPPCNLPCGIKEDWLMNKVILTREQPWDPELKYLDSGKAVCFTLAVPWPLQQRQNRFYRLYRMELPHNGISRRERAQTAGSFPPAPEPTGEGTKWPLLMLTKLSFPRRALSQLGLIANHIRYQHSLHPDNYSLLSRRHRGSKCLPRVTGNGLQKSERMLLSTNRGKSGSASWGQRRNGERLPAHRQLRPRRRRRADRKADYSWGEKLIINGQGGPTGEY